MQVVATVLGVPKLLALIHIQVYLVSSVCVRFLPTAFGCVHAGNEMPDVDGSLTSIERVCIWLCQCKE